MIVDDHTLFREGVKEIVKNFKDIKVVAEVENGLDAIDASIIHKPDILLLDIVMPKMDGLQTLRKIKDLGIESKVIILSSYSNRNYIIDAIKIGANGYLTKDCSSVELVKSIRSVYAGESYLQPSLIEILRGEMDIDNLDEEEMSKIDLLSRREYEVFCLMAKGYSNREIGKLLFISEKTVKNHITNVYKKIGVEDRVQGVIFAYTHGVAEL